MQKSSEHSQDVTITSIEVTCKLFLELLSYVCIYDPQDASSFLYFRLQRAKTRSFYCSMSRGWAAALPAHRLQNGSYSHRKLLHLPGAGSWACLPSPLINKCCATWAWYCLFPVTSNHVLISFLGGTYLPLTLTEFMLYLFLWQSSTTTQWDKQVGQQVGHKSNTLPWHEERVRVYSLNSILGLHWLCEVGDGVKFSRRS